MSLLVGPWSESRVEDVSLCSIAERFGTPCYVYSRQALADAYDAYRTALAGRNAHICYAVKANSILKLFAAMGAGFDIVSGGELARVVAAGGDPGKVVFSGVGKSREEMHAALAADISCFNVESRSELDHLNVDAAMNDLARPALYDAWHDIVKVGCGVTAPVATQRYEIACPICESGDFLGHDRELAFTEGDLLAVLSAGAKRSRN